MNVDKWISNYFSNTMWANVTRQKVKKYRLSDDVSNNNEVE